MLYPSFTHQRGFRLEDGSGDRNDTYPAATTDTLVPEDRTDKDPKKNLILCDEKLRRLYALQFAELPDDFSIEFNFVNDPSEFGLLCLQNAPTASLVDLATLIRGKTEEMNRLFSFRCRWPVLRSRIGSDGVAEIIRASPPLKGPFEQTLLDLIEGDSVWENTDESRRHLHRALPRSLPVVRERRRLASRQRLEHFPQRLPGRRIRTPTTWYTAFV